MSARLDDIVYGEVAAIISNYLERHSKLGDIEIGNAEEIADIFVEHFLTVNTVDDERLIRRFNVVNISASGTGYSQRLGNIIINWRKVLRDAPGIVLTGAGTAGNLAMLLLAAAAIGIQLHGHTRVELDDVHVAVIKAVVANAAGDPPAINVETIPHLCAQDGIDEKQVHSAIDQLCQYAIARLDGGVLILEDTITVGA